ncbi:HNH endonuclease [Streptomyces fungicidicus]|uniref:HNH endonuclease n=1 Tax=Streptomyces fungicidicus TaxID=68203 RepID=UPI003816BF8B
MAVSKRLRYEIFRRDNHTCRYCGASAPDVPLRVDHVTPVALGGTDEPGNLVTSCEPCNNGKSSSSPDATHVAAVSDDALRWADAMKQAAEELRAQDEPKRAYRDAFHHAWNEWTWERGGKKETFDLPAGWKTSLDAFREAGLPLEVWPDIIEKAMTNRTVNANNLFRYSCGIGWRKVRELQERARTIAGAIPTQTTSDSRASVLNAAFSVWSCGLRDNGEAPSAEQEKAFRRSLEELSSEPLEDPARIIAAAQHATYFEFSDIASAMRDMDRDRVCRAWIAAWPTTWEPGDEPWGGKFVGGPSEEAIGKVRDQVEKLLDADVYVARLVRAATHAGIHKSVRIYQGLTEDELKVTGLNSWRSQASELWRVAFAASGEVEPSKEETARFFASLDRIVADGEFYVADVYTAASAAGSYQDPDVTTCLPRHLSATEAASMPLQSTS